MISFKHTGNFDKTSKFLTSMKTRDVRHILDRYGRRGVDELTLRTPKDSGRTASMWGYQIHSSREKYEIIWTNDNVKDNISIAVLLQYGHGTRNGGYVMGTDYINPALRKIFQEMADEIWKEVVEV